MRERPRRTLWRVTVAATAWSAGASLWGQAIAAEFAEAAVKAAFIYRFAAYVEWPPDALPEDFFTIAVIGDDQAQAALVELSALKIQARSPRIVKVATPRELQGAQIVYVGRGFFPVAERLLAGATGSILIVSDGESGLRGDSVINFIRVGANVRFEVSLLAAERRQLKVSSGLLSVAARVEGRPRAGLVCRSPRWQAVQESVCRPLLARLVNPPGPSPDG